MRNLYKNEQTGRSMVEMLGVLAIVGVLSVGGIAGYSKAMAKFKISKTTDQVSMIIANIRTLWANQSSYNGLTNATAISYKIVGSDMGSTSANIRNAFGGLVDFAVAGTGDINFTVAYDNIPQDACMTIMTADWGQGIVSLQSNTGTIRLAADLPASLSEAAADCTACDGTAGACTITWTYQ